jgi:hypothetical protein
MKFLSSLFLLLCVLLQLKAQQLSPFVISAGGGEASGAGVYLSYTTAEMSAVETYSSGSSVLTQGFQQPWDLPSGVLAPAPVTGGMSVYPNPSDGHLNVAAQPAASGPWEWTLSDLLGRELLRRTVVAGSSPVRFSVDASRLAAGIYIARFSPVHGRAENGKRYYQKIQISK